MRVDEPTQAGGGRDHPQRDRVDRPPAMPDRSFTKHISGPRVSPHRESALVTWLDRSAGLAAADVAWLRDRVEMALEHLAPGRGGEVRVVSVGDGEMTLAHARALGIDETTDVLTFDLSDRSGPLDADIMVCVDEARRRGAGGAGGAGPESARRELLLYAVHGVLHCLGHDDHDEADFERMHALEDEVLTAIGVGPVFRSGDAPSSAGGKEGARG